MESLITVTPQKQFSLGNERISYLFQVSPEGILEHLYFGRRLSPLAALPCTPRRVYRGAMSEFEGVQDYNLSDTPQEYPLFGRSESRQPALHVINGDGNTTNTLRYQSHQILTEKPPLKGLPNARGGHSETLEISLRDDGSHLCVTLRYTVYRDHDVVAKSAEISNDGDSPVVLLHVMSSCLDLPASDYELIHLRGTWAREFNMQRVPVPAGRFCIESTCGVSSNNNHPFVAIVGKDTTEQHGEVTATTLMYSGNFAMTVEQGEFDSVRLCSGINPFNFQWQLAPGETFQCPEALHVFTAQGLEAMSQQWHAFVREQISPSSFRHRPRPTYLNTWEAAYFDVSEDLVLKMADQAVELGVEMVVVDDGWFKGRSDDSAALGDWQADPKKFPNGIAATAAAVQSRGLLFGLWFEPEMVSPSSDLYKQHPEWVMQVPGRQHSMGRNQLLLDLSQAAVVDHLYQQIDQHLASGRIDYIKWDMNRVMTEIGSTAWPAAQQMEVAHRYQLGLYELLSRLTEKYPNVLFENCASGGNRFDLGMLRYMAQGWVSDMSEPIGRLAVMQGASLLFPPTVLAAYIGPSPSHQNDRATSIELRRNVGFFCAARGLSLNLDDLQRDHKELKQAIAWYRETAEDVLDGQFWRLRTAEQEICWQLSSADGARIYLGYFHILAAPNLPLRRVRLRGLRADADYRIESNDTLYRGDALMYAGLDLPYVHALQKSDIDYMPGGDFSSCLLTLRRE